MVPIGQPRAAASPSLWITLGVAFLLPFLGFLRGLGKAWLADPEFSYGILIPLLVGYLLWQRREQLRNQGESVAQAGLP